MPRRSKDVYLMDIIRGCDELLQLYADAGSYEQFSATNYFVRTAERCLQIVGEALYHINNYDRAIAITDKERIIKLRHLLTHDYDLIESDRLWLYIRDFIPLLKAEVVAVVESTNENPKWTYKA